MIRMAQANNIRDLYENEGLSLREISRRTGVSVPTVRKYANKTNWNVDKLPNIEPKSFPSLEAYIPFIDEKLESDLLVQRKQRHTAKRLYDRLQNELGFKGSYSNVKRYVRIKKSKMQSKSKGYLPLSHSLASGQVDFGEFMYHDAEHFEHKGYALTISFPNSNMCYTQVFKSQNQECLLTGMQHIFEYIGGVPPKLLFDNLSAAVVQVLKGTERVLTEGFLRFKNHYRFQANFCNPCSGNEKGNVENKVGYVRRNAFVPIPTITTFEDFNKSMWDWCEQDAKRQHYLQKIPIQELWQSDKDHLLALPEYPFSVFRYACLRVNNCGFATIDTNKYGLAPNLKGETVQAKIFFDHVEFFHDRQLVGKYKRSYSHNEQIYDWTQYVPTLCEKPGAVGHTKFFHLMPQLWQQHLMQIEGKDRKSALQLLNEIVHDGNADMCDTLLELASESGRTDTDSVRQCYYLITKKEFRPSPLTLLTDAPLLHYNPNLSVYDGLMEERKAYE